MPESPAVAMRRRVRVQPVPRLGGARKRVPPVAAVPGALDYAPRVRERTVLAVGAAVGSFTVIFQAITDNRILTSRDHWGRQPVQPRPAGRRRLRLIPAVA